MVKTFDSFNFLFTKRMLAVRTEIHKILTRIANRDEPDQTASSEPVWYVSMLYIYAFLVGN